MAESVIKEATFNPKVKTYFLINALFVATIFLVSIPLIPIIALIVWKIADKQLKAMSARLMEKKLVVKRGIWFVVEKSIPLEKITDVAMSQGPLMRYFNLYALSFETAGSTSTEALVKLVGINDAAEFREAILAQKDKLADQTDLVSGSNASMAKELKATSPSIDADDVSLASLAQSVQNIESLLTELVNRK